MFVKVNKDRPRLLQGIPKNKECRSDLITKEYCVQPQARRVQQNASENASCNICHGLSSCVKVVPIVARAPITNQAKSKKFKVQAGLPALPEYR